MTAPPGRLEFTFGINSTADTRKLSSARQVGHVLFVASYSGPSNSATRAGRLVARPLEAGGTFAIVPGCLTLEPLTGAGNLTSFTFDDADGLQPDVLLESVASLRELWEPLRELEREPGAALRLQSLLEGTAVPLEPAPIVASDSPREGEQALLSRLLGQASAAASPPAVVAQSGAEALVQRLAERVVGESSLVSASPAGAPVGTADLRRRAEAELGRRLRGLLRQSAYEAVAGSWLGTEMVVRSCPDDSRARFSAVDAPWTQLVAAPTELQLLLETGVSVMVVDHRFLPDELDGLEHLVRTCQAHNTFLVVGADPALAGMVEPQAAGADGGPHDIDAWQSHWRDSEREAWQRLAALREAGAQFALVLPRCLVRYPFGRKGVPLDKLDFEELGDHPVVGDFQWANGAYLVARALVEQWCGGTPHLDGSYEIGGLPVVTVADGHGRRMQPPVDFSLQRSVVELLLEQGFSVVEARQNSDRVSVHV